MNCQPNLVWSPLPTGSCLPEDLYDYLSSSSRIVVEGCPDCICFVTQSTSPNQDQTSFHWIFESTVGVPLYRQVFYNGEWRTFPTFPIGAEVFFGLDPSLYFDPVTGFGIHGGQWDGWKINTDDVGRFPILSTTYSPALGWTANWNFTDVHIGGVSFITLDATNTYRPSSPGVTLYGWEAVGNHPGGAARLLGLFNTGAPPNNVYPSDAGNISPAQIPIWPSFVAKASIKYIGLLGS